MLCGVFSCLVLSAEKLGQESQCLQVVFITLFDFDGLIKGAELFLRILFSPKQNSRGNGCGLVLQLMQGNELSNCFSSQFWESDHAKTLNSRTCIIFYHLCVDELIIVSLY